MFSRQSRVIIYEELTKITYKWIIDSSNLRVASSLAGRHLELISLYLVKCDSLRNAL